MYNMYVGADCSNMNIAGISSVNNNGNISIRIAYSSEGTVHA